MKFPVQFMLSFYSLGTLRFKGMYPGTFRKEHISLLSVFFNGIVNKTEMGKSVVWKFCLRVVENMNLFSVANMCLLYAMSICK